MPSNLIPKTDTPTAGGADSSWGWTRTHQIGLGVLLVLLLIFLGIQLYRRPMRWSSGIRLRQTAALLTPRTVDPNTAGWASLIRLPGLGPSRVAQLLAYRQRWLQGHPREIVFRRLNDLGAIPGFGPVTLRHLAAYLRFPAASRHRGNGSGFPGPLRH